MSQAHSTTVASIGGASEFRDVFRAELAVVLPKVTLPGKQSNEDAELATIAQTLDRPETEELAALCLSGGGIRSASFGLGVLQSLARFKVLEQFHYLSTVSGGGYIGSWLSAWRSNEDDEHVLAGLTSMQTTGSEPPQITGIRSNSNYITPQLGLFSADTWTVVAVYIRNLLLNWVLFLPILTGCLLIPHLCAVALRWARLSGTQPGGMQAGPWLGAACALLAIGLACAVWGRFRGEGLWLTKARFLQLVLAPLVLSAMCFTVASRLDIQKALGFSAGQLAQEHRDAAFAGAAIYALAWLIGRIAAWRWDKRILVPDLICWILSGAAVGFLISLGLEAVAGHQHNARLTAVLGLSGFVLAYLVGDIFYVGAASLSRRGDMDREWLARASGWLAAVAVSWAVVSALVLYGPQMLLNEGRHLDVDQVWATLMKLVSPSSAQEAAQPTAATPGPLAWLKAVGVIVTGLSGILTLFLGPSALTSATRAGQAKERFPISLIASIAAVIFAASIGILLSLSGQLLVASLCVARSWCSSEHDITPLTWLDPPVIVILVVVSLLISLFVNVNRFSLHAMYRNRLVRAFLGSTRTCETRHPDPFTGFDPKDNASLANVEPRTGKDRLFHVINTTLNVVGTRNPAWQERKAESFSMTRLHCGNRYVGYRLTGQYGGKHGGITLGTAMAISGAAVSPNHGYSSSPLVGFLLMLFNLRLGWWLGNPSRKLYWREGPKWSISPALKELAGATTDQGRWIYLSDGGHFDNLGLYEMVRRRCRCIVVVDAGCDPEMKFEDLGNAVRKSYIDFGVNIDFRRIEIEARQNPPVAGARFGLATISYPRSPRDTAMPRTGWLLYIKPTYYCSTEGVDVRGYASDHPSFPHESTTDQWFSESQLEAYRALGAHIMEHICNGGTALSPGVMPETLSLDSLHSKAQTILDQRRPQRIDPTTAGEARCGY
jgi:Patatin-like phospholipase